MAAGIVHIEFKSSNFTRTSEFYARVFDWQTEQNGTGSYMKLNGADGTSGGWVRADLVQAPGPVAYVTVDDLESKLAEVERAGGRVLVRSLPFAGGGEVALFADPDGNVLGLWRRKVAPAAPGGSEKVARPAKPEKASKAAKTSAPKGPAKKK